MTQQTRQALLLLWCVTLALVSSQGNEKLCEVPNPAYVGNGRCDPPPYNTHECLWDRGDCCEDTCEPPRQFLCGSVTTYNCDNPFGDCSEFLDQGKLDILFHPQLIAEESGFLTLNNLTLVVRVPVVYDPTKTVITFVGAEDDGSELDPDSIFYPDRWSVDLNRDPCWIYFTLHVPWLDFKQNEGGLVEEDLVESFEINSGVMCIDDFEVIWAMKPPLIISEYRQVTDKIPFMILFPRFVETQIRLDIHFVPMHVEAVILQNILAVDPGGDLDGPAGTYSVHAILQLRTLIEENWFFFAENPAPTISVENPDHRVTVENIENCDINSPDICMQLWEIEIWSNSDNCDIDGNYMMNMSIGCKPGVVCDPMLDPGEMFLIVDIILDGTEVCPQIQIEGASDLSAELTSYYEGCFGIDWEEDTFAIDDIACFIAETNSDQLGIVGTDLVKLVVTDVDSGQESVLYDRGMFPTPEVDLKIFDEEEVALPNWAQFEFTMDEILFPGYDGWSQLDVAVQLEVVYSNLLLEEVEIKMIRQARRKKYGLLQDDDGNGNGNGNGNEDDDPHPYTGFTADVDVQEQVPFCKEDGICDVSDGDHSATYEEKEEADGVNDQGACCFGCYKEPDCFHWDFETDLDKCRFYTDTKTRGGGSGGRASRGATSTSTGNYVKGDTIGSCKDKRNPPDIPDDDCHKETGQKWSSNAAMLVVNTPANADACCQMCKDTRGCKYWDFKNASSRSRGTECSLKNGATPNENTDADAEYSRGSI